MDQRHRSEPSQRKLTGFTQIIGVGDNSYLADCLLMARPILIRLSEITPRPPQRCIPSSPR